MKERYLYYRLSGELCEKRINMWRQIDIIVNTRNSVSELENEQAKLADIQADIDHFKKLHARILRMSL